MIREVAGDKHAVPGEEEVERLRANGVQPRVLSHEHLEAQEKHAKDIIHDSACLIVFFFATCPPFVISCFLNLVGLYPPLWFDMLSGLRLKTKIPIDVFFVWTMRSVQVRMRGGGRMARARELVALRSQTCCSKAQASFDCAPQKRRSVHALFTHVCGTNMLLQSAS